MRLNFCVRDGNRWSPHAIVTGKLYLLFKKEPFSIASRLPVESGDDLSSRAVASQVLSTCEGLTSVFGMGTGGTPQP